MACRVMDRSSYMEVPHPVLSRTAALWLSGRTPWNLWPDILSFHRPSILRWVQGDESMHEKRHEASRQVVQYSYLSACFYQLGLES